MSDPAALSTPCRQCGAPMPPHHGGVCLVCLGREVLQSAPAAVASFAPDVTLSATEDEAATRALAQLGFPRQFGPYGVIEEIGRGGMGVVYAARHDGLGRIVALKVISDGRFASVERETRFVREAQTNARLQHPNIVGVHDAGRIGGVAYYAMDFVEGLDLARTQAADPLEPREAARVVAAIAHAVQHAHDRGVVHRDLKPSNILLDAATGEPRIVDFGLAQWTTEPADLTRSGQIIGSPAYMAPEQARGAWSPAVDIYSLGAVLYFLLTGRPPFDGGTALEVLARIGQETPRPPGALRADIPPELDAICLRCLEKSPSARYPTAGEVAAELERWLAGGSPQTHYAPAAEARRLVQEVRDQLRREGYQFHLIESVSERLARAAQLAPALAAPHAELARLHTTMVNLSIDATPARRELARQALEKAETLDATSADTRTARALYVLNIENDAAGAWPLLSALARELPDDLGFQGTFARACIRLGRWADVKQSLQHRITKLEPSSVAPRQQLSAVHYYLREYGDAVAWIREALRLDSTPLYRRLAAIWYHWLADPQPTRTLRELRALPDAEHRSQLVAWCECQVLLTLRRFDEAFAVYHASYPEEDAFSTQDAESNAYLLRLARWAGTAAAGIEAAVRNQMAPGRAKTVTSPKEALQHAYVLAVLGRRNAALVLADQAVNAATPEQDALEGARNAGANEFLTVPGRLTILALVDERERFFAEFERLINLPAAIDPRYLAMDPTFDALRTDPRFDRIMATLQMPIRPNEVQP